MANAKIKPTARPGPEAERTRADIIEKKNLGMPGKQSNHRPILKRATSARRIKMSITQPSTRSKGGKLRKRRAAALAE